MHSVLARMRLETPLGSYKVRKEGEMLEFEIIGDDFKQSALQFLAEERLRLKSIEEDIEDDKKENKKDSSSNKSSKAPTLHTRSRSQKSLFDFEEDNIDPCSPVLDGRDINRQ